MKCFIRPNINSADIINTVRAHRRWNAHIRWMGSLFSVNNDSSRDSRNSSSTRYSGNSSVRIIRTNCTHIDITLTISNVLDRYQKYLDVKFSMFRELIKLGRNNRSKCALWLKLSLFAKSLLKSSATKTTKTISSHFFTLSVTFSLYSDDKHYRHLSNHRTFVVIYLSSVVSKTISREKQTIAYNFELTKREERKRE